MNSTSVVSEQRPKLTVIVVSWNTRQHLRDCLASIEKHICSSVVSQVIVVDNASSDGSGSMVAAEFPAFELLQNTENVGYVQANNMAARKAQGAYILLLNSDTRVEDDGIADLIQSVERDNSIGIATGRMCYEDGTFQPPYRRFSSLVGSLYSQTALRITTRFSRYRQRHRCEDLNPDIAHDVDWVTGAYLLMRREMLDDGVIFDSALFMYYEDTLLCKRVWDRGFRVVYFPIAPVTHYCGKSADQVRPFAIRRSFEGSKIYIQRRYGAGLARFYAAAVVGSWRLFGVGFAVLAWLPVSKIKRKAELFRALVHPDPLK